jgi:hypothetical protein
MTTGRINQIAIVSETFSTTHRGTGDNALARERIPAFPDFFTSDRSHFPLHRKHGVAGKSLDLHRADCVLQTRRPFRGLGQCETFIEPPILLGCVSTARRRWLHATDTYFYLHWRDLRAEPAFYREASRETEPRTVTSGTCRWLRGSADPSVT